MTIVPTISFEDLKINNVVYYYWDVTIELRSSQITEKLWHWDKNALAFGALVKGLFVNIEPYNRLNWDKRQFKNEVNRFNKT